MITVDAQLLQRWLSEQRWFASKSRELSAVNLLESLVLAADESAELTLALVEARFSTGTHELYQVLLARRADEAAAGGELDDAVGDPVHGAVLAGFFDDEATVAGAHGSVRIHRAAGSPDIGRRPQVRPMGAEQSNSSVILDDRYVLKVFRRLEAGHNPELEMLGFLTRVGFANTARLQGWYGYSGELMEATLGVVQDYVAGAKDGWALALAAIGSQDAAFVEQLRELGRVTGELHRALGSASDDPDFAPEEPSPDALGLLVATVDDQLERVWVDLPATDAALEPILHRGQEIRDRLQAMRHAGLGGRQIRHHGDFHLGQTLLAVDGRWIILDFEGEPARSLRERRRKRSPLRDVAGMLRSLAYAASASDLLTGRPTPDGWEEQARAAFLGGYFERVDMALLPAGPGAIETLLSLFELEKAVYELRYELDNRPGWVGVPVAGIARLLEQPVSA